MQTKQERKRRKERRRKLRRIRKQAKMIAAAFVIAIAPMSIGAPREYETTTQPKETVTRSIVMQEKELPAYLLPEDVPTWSEQLADIKEAAKREKIKREEEARKAAEAARVARLKKEAAEKAARESRIREQARAAQEAERIQAPSGDSRGTIRGTNGNRRLMSVTAYTAGYESTQKRKGEAGYGITASGTTVSQGRTLACGPSYPFGTKIDIPSLGISGICEDRGGAITDSHIDVYIADLSQAQDFGRKKVEVIIH